MFSTTKLSLNEMKKKIVGENRFFNFAFRNSLIDFFNLVPLYLRS